jgi:hypothetical protein
LAQRDDVVHSPGTTRRSVGTGAYVEDHAPLFVAWANGTWSLFKKVAAPGSQLMNVSCADATICVLGEMTPSQTGLATVGHGGTWGAGQSLPYAATAVACASGTSCFADAGGTIAHWDGMSWSTQTLSAA